ncbi:hypothetical protein CYMTET_25825 [Cymbomonas tetramitiformis]|uniref:Uncharacterized protein n=1 Tax=Cymbomonas tetramitiformis TaxID=36881 RepID=A0AAE0FT00_9CHLO|nr:hypothetical protein CYMTET_25825 [Cymbomonas tetramitiformis]
MPRSQGDDFDWCSFYALFWNDKGINFRLDIPDTVLLRNSYISAWWGTDKKGHIKRHLPAKTTWEAIRLRFLNVALEDKFNTQRYVAIVRRVGMPPRLVKRNEFNELAETLSEITEGGGARPYGLDNAPVYCIQMYISPSLDLRYVTTYVCDGDDVACHTFPRRYSRRYNGRGMNDEDAGGEADADEVDPRAVALDVSLKSKFRSILAAVVKYIERAHGLTLAGIVVEFVRDAMGNILLLGVLRVEWATHGFVAQGTVSGTNATRGQVADVLPEHQEHLPPHTQPLPLEPSIDDLSQAEVAASTFLTQEASVHRLSYRPESRGTPLTDPVSMFRTRSPSPDRIRPGSATSTSSQQIQNSWPSAIHHERTRLQPRAARPASARPASQERPGASGTPARPTSARRARRPESAQHLRGSDFSTPTPVQRPMSAVTRPASALSARDSDRHDSRSPPPRHMHASSPTQSMRPGSAQSSISQGTKSSQRAFASGHGVAPIVPPDSDMAELVLENSMPRPNQLSRITKPILHSQTSKELDAARDELYFQHEMADATAHKVGTLEGEREQMVSSFNSRVTTLDGTLFQCRQQVEEAVALLQLRDAELKEATLRTQALAREKEDIMKEITHDREEIMSVIKRYHDKERELEHLVGEHESKRCQLDGELAEEQQTVIALRNQAEQYEQMIKVEADATQKTKLTTVYAEGRTNKPIVIDEPEQDEVPRPSRLCDERVTARVVTKLVVDAVVTEGVTVSVVTKLVVDVVVTKTATAKALAAIDAGFSGP